VSGPLSLSTQRVIALTRDSAHGEC